MRQKKLFLLLVIILLASCTAQRRYPTYSTKKCHWDTGGYEAQMRKKDNK